MVMDDSSPYTCACIVVDLCHAVAILCQEIKEDLYLHG